jgi:hypothetical protein
MKRLPFRIVDDMGITDSSLALWRLTRPLFGDFREAVCVHVGDELEDVEADVNQPGIGHRVECGRADRVAIALVPSMSP